MFFKSKYKKLTHRVAVLLMQEWDSIMEASRNNLRYGLTDEEIAKLDSVDLYVDFGMALLGVMTYIVSGLGKPEVATEMIEVYRGLYEQYPADMFNKVPTIEAEYRINRHYQKAREIADEYMRQGKSLDHILHAFAVSVFIWIGSKYDDDDVAFVENALNIFYSETQEKFRL